MKTFNPDDTLTLKELADITGYSVSWLSSCCRKRRFNTKNDDLAARLYTNAFREYEGGKHLIRAKHISFYIPMAPDIRVRTIIAKPLPETFWDKFMRWCRE